MKCSCAGREFAINSTEAQCWQYYFCPGFDWWVLIDQSGFLVNMAGECLKSSMYCHEHLLLKYKLIQLRAELISEEAS